MTINFATGFSAISNQETAVHRLTGFIQSGNIPHALLFTGIEGIGKKKTALAFAASLNCQTIGGGHPGESGPIEPCGQCRPCKKIAAGHHPDVIVVTPEQSRIKISTIRDLGHMLAAKPYEALHRIVIIDQAQAMNPQAANSLLKLLEEPPADTILILIAVNTFSLLPTIVSRCQQLRFKPIPDKIIAGYLKQRGIIPEQADILGNLANGSFARAKNLAETDWLNRREWIIRVFERFRDQGGVNRRSALVLAFSERLAKDRETVIGVLDFMKSLLRDMAVVKGGSEKVVNRDLLPRLRQAAQRCTTETVLADIDRLETARKKIEANANIRLTMDVMLMNLFVGPKGG